MKKKPFISLKVRMSIGIVSMCLLISLLAILLMFRTIKDIVDKDYIDKAEQITEAVVSSLDAYDVKELTDVVVGIYDGIDNVVPSSEWGSDEWNEYIAKYESVEDLPAFSRIRDQLREYQDIFHVNCFYIMYFDPDIRHAVYVVDGAYEDACPPGVCDAYEEGFWPDKKETEEKAITMEALAVKDSLTGVWNGLAYEDAVKKLNAEIREGFTEFGIAMIDLNDLKKINDTYGHQNGNIAIKSLCSVICDVFKRSRVFRIGGDEFAVILKKKDFKNIEQRMADFNEQLESLQKNKALQPWEKVSAAIGYAKFDEDTDVYVDDVFKKADYAMYARKASMKVRRGV